MKKTTILFIIVLGVKLTAWPQINIAKENQPSVVCVETECENGTGLGSGFFVEEDIVATNWHVVSGANEIKVNTSDGIISSGKLLIASPQHDLALVKLDKTIGSGRAVRLRCSEAQELETIYVCGHPEALAFSWSSGTVANSKRILDPGTPNAPNCTLIQLNAAISQGSSGGPMFDQEGKVLGIITGQWQEGQNLNFAIPVSLLKELMDKSSNMEKTRKEIWLSKEWKDWRKIMNSGSNWDEKYKAAASVLYVHGPIPMMFVDFGSEALRANEFDLAEKSFSQAVLFEPQNPRAWLGKGLVDLKKNEKPAAKEAFSKAISFGKQDEEVTLVACQGLERAGEKELALSTLRKAVESNPEWTKVRAAISRVKSDKKTEP